MKYVFFAQLVQMSTSEEEYDIRTLCRALHYIFSRTWSAIVFKSKTKSFKKDKVFKSANVCFIMWFRNYLAFLDVYVLFVSPIVSWITFSIVLYKSPLSMLFTQNAHQRECYSANFAFLFLFGVCLVWFCLFGF